jgi:hypothetical protein
MFYLKGEYKMNNDNYLKACQLISQNRHKFRRLSDIVGFLELNMNIDRKEAKQLKNKIEPLLLIEDSFFNQLAGYYLINCNGLAEYRIVGKNSYNQIVLENMVTREYLSKEINEVWGMVVIESYTFIYNGVGCITSGYSISDMEDILSLGRFQ